MRKQSLNCMLLVDDDEGHNYLTQLTIEDCAVALNIRTAWNGREALDYLTGRGKYADDAAFPRPQLIFLDINMPVMDGWDFMAEYRALDNARKRDTMIVMLTTSMNPDDRERARGIPEISEFRIKPLTRVSLEEVIQKYFSEHGRFG
ncbi:MAG TPA: response regulator [Gammaproteobacteria bacterium]|nr:response regulator [Gammaproteobacteria bacterium]